MARKPTDKDVEQVWRFRWQYLLCNEDGTLDLHKVKNALYDYAVVMEEVSKVYDELTEGNITKPNTVAVHVISAITACFEKEEMTEEAMNDAFLDIWGEI